MNIDQALRDRFFAKTRPDSKTGCLLWIGALSSKKYGKKYGVFQIDGRAEGAHRVAFFLEHGTWPQPETRHTCDNPPCVAPEHLRAGTEKENAADSIERGRHWQKNKTHCAKGHAYDERNTRICPDGSRRCHACHRIEMRKQSRTA